MNRMAETTDLSSSPNATFVRPIRFCVSREETEAQLLKRIVAESYNESKAEFGGECAREFDALYQKLMQEINDHIEVEAENMQLTKAAKEVSAQLRQKRAELLRLRNERIKMHRDMDTAHAQSLKKRRHRQMSEEVTAYLHETDVMLHYESQVNKHKKRNISTRSMRIDGISTQSNCEEKKRAKTETDADEVNETFLEDERGHCFDSVFLLSLYKQQLGSLSRLRALNQRLQKLYDFL